MINNNMPERGKRRHSENVLCLKKLKKKKTLREKLLRMNTERQRINQKQVKEK